ncbi:MAG: hypothetical protein PVI13_03255 [Desulfobacterales bacterium]|jgi:hypothetical protein
MMFFFDLMLVLFITLILTLVFAVGFRRQSWGGGLIVFFLILFLATWAGGVWITPFGPVWYGISWLPFLFVGLVIALLLTSTMRPDRIRPQRRGGVEMRPRSDTETIAALDAFMWILIGGLMLAILVGYMV